MATTTRPPFHRLAIEPGAEPGADPAAGNGRGFPASLAPVLAALAPLLDGSRSSAGVFAAALAEGVDAVDVSQAFRYLDDAGLLVEGDAAVRALDPDDWDRHGPQCAALARLAAEPGDRQASAFEQQGGTILLALRAATVLVTGSGPALPRIVEDLAGSGVGHVVPHVTAADDEPGDGPADLPGDLRDVTGRPVDLVVSTTGTPAERRHTAVSRRAVESGTPALFHHVRGAEAVTGPFLQPGQSACFECFDLRRRAADPAGAAGAAGTVGLAVPVGVELLVLDALRFLGRVAAPVTRGHVLRTDLRTGVPTVHSVLRLPRCPGCGRHRDRPLRRLWAVDGP